MAQLVSVNAPSLISRTCYEKGFKKFWETLEERPKTLAGGVLSVGGLAVLHFGALPIAAAVAGTICALPAALVAGLAVAWLPKTRGQHRVGSFDTEVEVPAGKDYGRHKLPVRVFFPASPCTNGSRLKKQQWLPEPNNKFLEACGSVYGSPASVSKVMLHLLKTVKMEAYEDQKIADGKWPIVFFSHGLFGNRSMYSAYCTEIASHGYVVLAPEHMDGSAVFACTSEKEQPYIPGSEVSRQTQLQQRVGELEALWSALPKLQESDSHFRAGCFDLSHCGLTGHSFGAGTVLLASNAASFRSVGSTVVIMDPWMEVATPLVKDCPSPVMSVMTGSMVYPKNVQSIVQVLALADGNRQSALMIEQVGARHQDMSDVPFIIHVPMGALTASSQTRLGRGMWEENADLVLHFLRARGRIDEELQQQIASVPHTLLYDWKGWVDASGTEK